MLEKLREIALDAGLDPDRALEMTVLDFMRAVADARTARGERSEWLRNVQQHCDNARRASLATMSALGKSSSKLRKAVST